MAVKQFRTVRYYTRYCVKGKLRKYSTQALELPVCFRTVGMDVGGRSFCFRQEVCEKSNLSSIFDSYVGGTNTLRHNHKPHAWAKRLACPFDESLDESPPRGSLMLILW